jgi:hypothetical protein
VDHIPGAREIPDPEAEMRRLAEARNPHDDPASLDPAVWTVEQRVMVTHIPTRRYAEAATQDEALTILAADLVGSGDIPINDARKAHGLPPFDIAGLDQPRGFLA